MVRAFSPCRPGPNIRTPGRGRPTRRGRNRPGLCWLVVDDPTKRPKRHYFHWRPGFHPGREMPQKQPIPTMECKAADPTQSHRDPQLEGRVPPRPEGNDSIGGPGSTRAKGRGGTHPSMSAQRLRGREALGVRPLAGAFGPPHCARRPTILPLPSTSDRMGCSPDAIAHSRAGFPPTRVPEQQRATRLLALPRPQAAPPKLRRYQMRPCRKIPKKVSVWRVCRKALAISPGEVPAWLVWVSPMRPAGRLPEPHEGGTTAR